jgi:transposase-like protein
VNILRRLREQAKDYNCSACGANHGRSEIKILGRLEAAWMVRVTCASCEASFKLLVYPDRERMAITPIKEQSARPRRAPVSLDEVIDAHEFLARYDGDAHALFASRGKVRGSTGA